MVIAESLRLASPRLASLRTLFTHLGTLINLRPKPLLQILLRLPEALGRPKLIQVRQHPHNLRKPANLQHVKKLKRLHLKPELGVHDQQHKVSNLSAVQHPLGSIRALDERHPPLLTRHTGHRTHDTSQVVVGVHLRQRADQRGLTHAGRAHHHADERRGVGRFS